MLLPRSDNGNDFATRALNAYTDATEYVYEHRAHTKRLVSCFLSCLGSLKVQLVPFCVLAPISSFDCSSRAE